MFIDSALNQLLKALDQGIRVDLPKSVQHLMSSGCKHMQLFTVVNI